MDEKQIIDQYFKDKFDFIMICATNTLKLIKKTYLASELVSELYHWLIESLKKPLVCLKIKEGLLEAMCLNWMKTQVVWNKTRFKYLYIYNRNISDKDISDMDNYIAEKVIEETYLTEEEHFNHIDILKLDHIKKTLEKLPLDKQILYNLRFVEKKKVSEIALETDISESNCYDMLANLKKQLIQDFNPITNL